MTGRLQHVGTICPVLLLLLAPPAGARAQGTSVPGTAQDRSQRAAGMQAHYGEAVRVHDAVVRGDLPGAREAARRLALHPEPGLPEQAAPFASALQQAAGRVVQASDITAAGASAAAVMGTCGDCHRAVGAMPAVTTRPPPTIGETVGHMLNHQRAAEQLMQGLVVPSTTAWNEGARALQTAPIARGKLPKDPKLTSDLMAGEKRLHELAERAAGATTTPERVAVYGEMIGTCAACHSLHPNVWGPGKR